MIFVAVFILLVTGVTVKSDRHSLTYIYTAFSHPVELPGIHKFTAMGLLDDKVIDYYDSDLQEKVPKQDWMKERLEADYWKKGTESRQSKERWFKVNIDILKERMLQNDTDLHVLQWLHGCEGDMQTDGSIKFHRGMDSYSYDGNDFLSFDDAHSVWVAPIPAAWDTKRKWDGVLALKDYTKGYLEKECIDWLGKFVNYGNQQLRKASRPDIYLFSKKAKIETNIILTCMATGFYPKHIILQIKRGDRILTREDGVTTTGTRPNDDDTYQRSDSVEILKRDKSTYKCIVIHEASGLYAEELWNGKLPESPNGLLTVVVPVVVLLLLVLCVAIVLVVLWKKHIIPTSVCQAAPTAPSVGQAAPTAPSVCQAAPTAPSVGQAAPTATSVGQAAPTASGSKESVSTDSGVLDADGADNESTGLLNGSNKDAASGSEESVSTGSGVRDENDQCPNPETEKMLQDKDPAV